MKTKLLSILLIPVVIMIGCDLFTVGLGEDVDINPPEVEITSPQTSTTEYMRDDFLVQGIVSDDISSTTVQVFFGDTTIDATVADGVWTATIPMTLVTIDMTLRTHAKIT